MTNITQAQLDIFKQQHAGGDPRIAQLTLAQVQENTAGMTVDWNALSIADPASGGALASEAAVSDCQVAIGVVVFDCISLFLGAVGLRAKLSPSTALNVARAAAPALSKIETIIADLARAEVSVYDKAKGVFTIVGTLYSGGCLGAVFSAFTASLSWWDMVLYGITGVATIVAALVTDGAATVAEIVLLLTGTAFLTQDVVSAVSACQIKPAPVLVDGPLVRDASDGKVYLTLDQMLRWVPDMATFNRLFAANAPVQNQPSVDLGTVGDQLAANAGLIRADGDPKVYLMLEGGKRWITSAAVFGKFNFDWNKIQVISLSDLNGIPTGADIN